VEALECNHSIISLFVGIGLIPVLTDSVESAKTGISLMI